MFSIIVASALTISVFIIKQKAKAQNSSPQPFPRNGVQFMVKHSRKYALTGGWGFAQFNEGKPADEAVHKTCFAYHEPAKARDFVFTRYAP